MADFNPKMDLSGHVALVTGSTVVSGHEIACALGQAGAKVALNYCHNEERAERAFGEYLSHHAEGALFRANITDAEAIDGLLQSIVATLGAVDILVVNATPPQPQRRLEDYEWSHVQTMLDAFVKSPFLLCQRTVQHMKAQRFGRIIQIGSEVFDEGTPNFSAMSLRKVDNMPLLAVCPMSWHPTTLQ